MNRGLVIVAIAGWLTIPFVVAHGQTAAPEPPVAEVKPAPRVVPHAKFVKAVTQRRAADRRVRKLTRQLRHEPSVQEALTLASITFGIDRGALSSVAWCESRHVAGARNGQYHGVMQLGDGFRGRSPYFPALSAWSPYANVMAAASVISRNGYSEWQCRPGGKLAW